MAVLCNPTPPETLFDPVPVYKRFLERGRLAPDGLTYLSSWVTIELDTCFQIMETGRRELLDEWLEEWKDLVDFEVYPIIASAEALTRVMPRLQRTD